MELSATAYVILGFLDASPRTGYEIKQIVDRSTRFFWAASYGQIYPELRRLEEAGLIRGTDRPRGGRSRKEYRLTATGRRELQTWLRRPPEVMETRDEGLLKLFFSGSLPEAAPKALEAKRRLHAEKLARLREIEPAVAEHATPYQYMTLRFGIALSEFCVRWCEEALEGLASEEETSKRKQRRSA
jgi:PadR family transcriptional regulator AphA